jgi:hypothetical protein
LRLTLSVNGEVRQDNTVADMIVPPAQALVYCLAFSPWRPVIAADRHARRTGAEGTAKPVEVPVALLPPQP